jgi:hypothetical protein
MFWPSLCRSTCAATSSVCVQQLAALLGADLAAGDRPGQQDLDVDLVVGGVHPGGVVDEVGVDQTAAERVLDPRRLGEAQVAALGDDPRPQFRRGDAHGVVGPIADLGVGLVRGLHVGADAAVPQQVDRRAQDRRDQLVR